MATIGEEAGGDLVELSAACRSNVSRLTYYAHVSVHRSYPLVRAGLEQFAGDELLQS